MPKREDFPVWTRNRAQRHAARGCSQRVLGLILKPERRRPPAPVAEAWPSNVLPFRIPAAAQDAGSALGFGGKLRQG